MRTNIDIDDTLMSNAMKAGPYQTKKEAVEAGLKLLARQVVYREILKWEGKLKWEGDESIDWTQPAVSDKPVAPSDSLPAASNPEMSQGHTGRSADANEPLKAKRRAGR